MDLLSFLWAIGALPWRPSYALDMFVCALFSSECCPTFSVTTKLLQIEIYFNDSNGFLKE